MSEEIRYNLIDIITKSSGYDIALMTTFNFEVDYFERAILNPLYERDVKKISVFVDSGELAQAIAETESTKLGKQYMVNPVRMNGSFHPKVFLLLGKDRAKLIVGSANLKTSGLAINNEVFNYVEYSAKEPKYLDVISAAIDFFVRINDLSYGLDNELFGEVKRLPYYRKARSNGEKNLVSSIDEPILKQVREIISGDVESISIAVPYYDNTLEALKAIRSVFPGAQTHLYVQNYKSTFPAEYDTKNGVADKVIVFNGFADGQDNNKNNFYHGKVFVFKTNDRAYALYGSSNCTGAALTKAYADGGNVECDFLDVGGKEDFDYFFSNMEHEVELPLKSEPLIYTNTSDSSFYYKYGEYGTDGSLTLHVGFKKVQPAVFYYGDLPLPYIVSDKEIIVTIEEASGTIPNIFTIQVEYEGMKEDLRCWTYQPDLIKINRIRQKERIAVESFEYASDDDKYRLDRINYYNAETMCLQDLLERKKKMAQMRQIKNEQEDNDSDEEYILDITVSEDYYKEYRTFETVSSIRDVYYKNLTSGLLRIFDFGERVVNKNTKPKSEAKPSRTGETISADKSFARFVSSKIKGLNNVNFIKEIELKHYYGIVLVTLEVFSKYFDEGMFDLFYIYKTRTDLLINTLTKSPQNDDELGNQILKDSMKVFIDNYLISRSIKDMEERAEYDSINKRLLVAINTDYDIRTSYKDILKEIIEADSEETFLVGNDLINYAENLFGYKNRALLTEYISERYNVATLEYGERAITVFALTEAMSKELNPDMSVVREVGNYSRNVEYIEALRIVIRPTKVAETDSKIKEIEHVINFKFKTLKSDTTYANGNKLEGKPEYVNV